MSFDHNERREAAEAARKAMLEKFKNKAAAPIDPEIAAQRAALYSLRQRNIMKQLDNTAAIRDARRTIARALTLLRERQLAGGRK